MTNFPQTIDQFNFILDLQVEVNSTQKMTKGNDFTKLTISIRKSCNGFQHLFNV